MNSGKSCAAEGMFFAFLLFAIFNSASGLGPRDLVASYYKSLVDGKNLSLFEELLTRDVVFHRHDMEIIGLDAVKNFLKKGPLVFSSVETVLHDVLLSRDHATARLSHIGVSAGVLPTRFGMFPVSQGTNISWNATSVFRFCGDKICEQWTSADEAGMIFSAGLTCSSQETFLTKMWSLFVFVVGFARNYLTDSMFK